MLELETDTVDRVEDPQLYNRDHVHDKQSEMNYQDLSLVLRNQSRVNHHHNPDKLKIQFESSIESFNVFINLHLPQRKFNEFALGLPETFGG